VLINWTYRGHELVPFEDLAVRVRGLREVRAVTSAWTGQKVALEAGEGGVVIRLPRLEEGDVLLVE
jgi:hypothetical protein